MLERTTKRAENKQPLPDLRDTKCLCAKEAPMGSIPDISEALVNHLDSSLAGVLG